MAKLGDLVACERGGLRLTMAACARLWQSCRDRKPEPWEGRFYCATCCTGAKRAGCSQPEPTLSDHLRRVCSRCLNPDSDRIIGERFCVSCYNRHREALVGRNAKGTRPRLADRLHTVRLAVGNGESAEPMVFEQVTGWVEALVAAAKRSSGPVFLGRPALSREPQP